MNYKPLTDEELANWARWIMRQYDLYSEMHSIIEQARRANRLVAAARAHLALEPRGGRNLRKALAAYLGEDEAEPAAVATDPGSKG